jgi:hypothetical protein
VRWAPDPTGRFPKRPYYEDGELDRLCEQVISDFLVGRYGKVLLPVPTEDLTVLIERDAADLDLFADLAGEEGEAQGVTDFFPGEKPRVRIAKELSEQEHRENRLRTTLTHEYGHVKLHAPLYDAEAPSSLFPELYERKPSPKCHRDTVHGTGTADWMEWQAGCASGALLMPLTHLARVVRDAQVELGIYGPCHTGSAKGRALIERVSRSFAVSRDAARVRLQKLGYAAQGSIEPSPLHRF